MKACAMQVPHGSSSSIYHTNRDSVVAKAGRSITHMGHPGLLMARKLAASNLGIDHSAREALEDFHEPPRFERWTLPPTRSCGTRWPSVNLLGFCLNAHDLYLTSMSFKVTSLDAAGSEIIGALRSADSVRPRAVPIASADSWNHTLCGSGTRAHLPNRQIIG